MLVKILTKDVISEGKKLILNKTKAFAANRYNKKQKPDHKYPSQYYSEICTKDNTYPLIHFCAVNSFNSRQFIFYKAVYLYIYISKTVINFHRKFPSLYL